MKIPQVPFVRLYDCKTEKKKTQDGPGFSVNFSYISVYDNESDTPTQNEPDEMICKLTMYDQTYFRGRSEEITGDVELFDLNIG